MAPNFATVLLVRQGRCNVFMVRVLDSRLSNPGSLCFVLLTVRLSTQVYEWVQANFMLGVTLWQTSIPCKGEVEILLVTSCYRNRVAVYNYWPGGPLAQMQTLPTVYMYLSFSATKIKKVSNLFSLVVSSLKINYQLINSCNTRKKLTSLNINSSNPNFSSISAE